MNIERFVYPVIMLFALLLGVSAIIYSQQQLKQQYQHLLQGPGIYSTSGVE